MCETYYVCLNWDKNKICIINIYFTLQSVTVDCKFSVAWCAESDPQILVKACLLSFFWLLQQCMSGGNIMLAVVIASNEIIRLLLRKTNPRGWEPGSVLPMAHVLKKKFLDILLGDWCCTAAVSVSVKELS